MKQTMAERLTEVVCYKEDKRQFIRSFLRLSKQWHRQTKTLANEWTIGCRYTDRHLRLIISTPGDVLSMYGIRFINDQVYVTVKSAAANQVA